MTRMTHLMAALATVVALAGQPAPSAVATFEIGVDQLTAEQTEIVESAVSTFVRAGLPLPAGLTIEFQQTSVPCQRGVGAYRPAKELISICPAHGDPAVAVARQRRVLVHELAHAWAENFLEPERKEAFLALRGAESWRSSDLRWRERGTEQSADIITWGIFDRDILFLAIRDKSCAELEEAFRVLTRLEPTAGLTHNCGAPPKTAG